jgi:hypothetical protein
MDIDDNGGQIFAFSSAPLHLLVFFVFLVSWWLRPVSAVDER